ncbi:hypothetical protein LS73_004175 [Helicobacter muridarum]|nr:hypothetical protein [Helicobacter muridarum]TLE00612.1 hypothetical protein LS73_004175 [Helicobacter muridarum]
MLVFSVPPTQIHNKENTQSSNQSIILKTEILQNIKTLYKEQALSNSSTIVPLSCMLSSKDISRIDVSYNKRDILAYAIAISEANALMLESRYSMDSNHKKEIPKSSQSILIESARSLNAPSILLTLQLYFSRQCPRCDVIRDISRANFYYKRGVSFTDVLESEGLFGTHLLFDSYVFKGEAFLCRALKTREPLDFVFAYANLFLAGLHTRAINAILEGLSHSYNVSYESRVLLDTFLFLSSINYILQDNHLLTPKLKDIILRYSNNSGNISLLKSIQSIPNFKSIVVLEYDVGSNFILAGSLARDMESKKLISPLSKLSSYDTIDEFLSYKEKYIRQISNSIFEMLPKASLSQLRAYINILMMKEKLKRLNQYPHAKRYIY